MDIKLTIAATVLALFSVYVAKGFPSSVRTVYKSEATSQHVTGGRDRTVSTSGYRIGVLEFRQINGLAKGLSKQQRNVLLEEGTERAFYGDLVDGHVHLWALRAFLENRC